MHRLCPSISRTDELLKIDLGPEAIDGLRVVYSNSNSTRRPMGALL